MFLIVRKLELTRKPGVSNITPMFVEVGPEGVFWLARLQIFKKPEVLWIYGYRLSWRFSALAWVGIFHLPPPQTPSSSPLPPLLPLKLTPRPNFFCCKNTAWWSCLAERWGEDCPKLVLITCEACVCFYSLRKKNFQGCANTLSCDWFDQIFFGENSILCFGHLIIQLPELQNYSKKDLNQLLILLFIFTYPGSDRNGLICLPANY